MAKLAFGSKRDKETFFFAALHTLSKTLFLCPGCLELCRLKQCGPTKHTNTIRQNTNRQTTETQRNTDRNKKTSPCVIGLKKISNQNHEHRNEQRDRDMRKDETHKQKQTGSLLYPCFKTALCYSVVSGCFVHGASPSRSGRNPLQNAAYEVGVVERANAR